MTYHRITFSLFLERIVLKQRLEVLADIYHKGLQVTTKTSVEFPLWNKSWPHSASSRRSHSEKFLIRNKPVDYKPHCWNERIIVQVLKRASDKAIAVRDIEVKLLPEYPVL